MGYTLGRAELGAEGRLTRGDGGPLPVPVAGASADLDLVLDGLDAPDPQLTEALAPGLRLRAEASWDGAAALAELASLSVVSGALRLEGNANANAIGSEAMAVAANVELDSGALSRFAALAGQDLRGRMTGRADVAFDVSDQDFDIDATLDGRDIATGIAEVDRLIGTDLTLIAQANRTDGVLAVEAFDLNAGEITLDATAAQTEDGTEITLTGALSDLGLVVPDFAGPIRLETTALQSDGTWTVEGGADGPGGSRIDIAGQALRPDGTVDLQVSGGLPLGLANRILAPRSITGDLTFDVAVQGEPGLEAVGGTITVAGARVSDPATRLALEDIGATVALSGASATLDVGGTLSTGGRITVQGPIGLSGDLPANLDIALNGLTLRDPTLYKVALDGAIGVDGPLAGGASIVGQIDIGPSEIKIPGGVGGAGAVPDVIHVAEPSVSRLTRERAGLIKDEAADAGAGGGGGGAAYPLDIRINAPQQIFVRGRGLDVEMGGVIEIGGTTANVVPSGDLSLIRGRLSLLSQRLEFEEATISLQGSLVPDLRMVASSDNGDIVAKIVIEGPVTDPEIGLTSEPELPEDEVLAQLFFSKPVSDLTPLELAQLAAAINELSGGSGGIFGALRDGLGVDDLDVATDADGTTNVKAGKYISERVYTDVTFGSDGTSEIELNYEITKDFKAQGSFDNSGNSAIGFSFERDY